MQKYQKDHSQKVNDKVATRRLKSYPVHYMHGSTLVLDVIVLYHTILYYTVLYYTILLPLLYYTILYYTILYYTILYYTIQIL